LLKVTQKFYDYFDVMAEQLKSKFESVEKKASALGVDINAKFVDTNSGNNGETIVNVNNLNSEANKGQTKLTENKLTEQQLEKEVEAEIKEIEKEEMKEAGSGHESKSEEKISTEIFDSENSEKKFETETAKDVNNTDGK
jgi:hypothetical protein